MHTPNQMESDYVNRKLNALVSKPKAIATILPPCFFAAFYALVMVLLASTEDADTIEYMLLVTVAFAMITMTFILVMYFVSSKRKKLRNALLGLDYEVCLCTVEDDTTLRDENGNTYTVKLIDKLQKGERALCVKLSDDAVYGTAAM